jgi:two-component system, LuxR family, response regulator FixJ
MTPAQPRRILVVDPDPAVRASLAFSLEIEGYGVEAYDSTAALAGRAGFPAGGCLVLDHRPPQVDALRLIDQLRGRGVDLPAVLIVTNPGQDVRKRATAAGIAIVEKPLLGDALLDAVRHARPAPCPEPSGGPAA